MFVLTLCVLLGLRDIVTMMMNVQMMSAILKMVANIARFVLILQFITGQPELRMAM
jgi:hypothetical protein